MVRAICVLLLLTLPSCIAAIGNRGGIYDSASTSSLPLLREKVAALRRIVELQKEKAGDLRSLHEAGRADASSVADAEIALEEANIRLLDCRAELQALEARKRD